MWLPGLTATETLFQTAGSTVTADGTPHTNGLWAELIASTPFHVTMLGIQSGTTHESSTNTGQLLDISVGASSSEEELISDIPTGWSALLSRQIAWFPVDIAAGTRIAGRIQAVIASDTVDIFLWMFGSPSWEQPRFQSIDTFGAVTASSAGTDLSSNAIMELIASTPNDVTALGVVFDGGVGGNFGGGTDGPAEIFVGAGGQEVTLIDNIFLGTGSGENIEQVIPFVGFYPLEFNIPAGSRLSVQLTDGRDLGAVLFGFR